MVGDTGQGQAAALLFPLSMCALPVAAPTGRCSFCSVKVMYNHVNPKNGEKAPLIDDKVYEVIMQASKPHALPRSLVTRHPLGIWFCCPTQQFTIAPHGAPLQLPFMAVPANMSCT